MKPYLLCLLVYPIYIVFLYFWVLLTFFSWVLLEIASFFIDITVPKSGLYYYITSCFSGLALSSSMYLFIFREWLQSGVPFVNEYPKQNLVVIYGVALIVLTKTIYHCGQIIFKN